jgi:hypothetical protein
MGQLEQRVLESLDHSIVAFNQGNPEFFDQFAEDAVIFTVDSPDPIRGRAAYRERHEASLTGHKRAKTILDRSVQCVGDRVVVTQTAQIEQDDNVSKVRQTYIYGDTNEGLKVMHLHTSLLSPARSCVEISSNITPTPTSVQIINEVISPMVPILGVAQ